MNVSLFQSGPGYPSIKWYFVAAIPLMVLVVICYFMFKRADQDKRRDPVERGAYEHIFKEFAAHYPKLWGRYGPRRYVKPKGFRSRMKWRLVTKWFDPSKTIAAKKLTDIDEMSFWARLQRRLAIRWLGQIDLEPGSSLTAAEMGEAGAAGGSGDEFGNFTELLGIPTGIALVDADPNAAIRLRSSPKLRQMLSGRRSRSSSDSRNRLSTGDRPQSPGSNVMVEEEKSSEDETSDREGEVVPSSSSGKEPRRAYEQYTPTEERPAVAGAQREGSLEHSAGDHAIMGLLSVPMNISRGSEHAP
jgi:hypothetical protein